MKLIIENNIEEITRLAPFVDELSEVYGIAPDLAFKINLALDEALANSINYAYPEGTVGTIILDVEDDGSDLVFRLTDEGTPFDPTKEGDVDTTLSVEERPIGGLGIFLIKQMMDSVTYERMDNKNILTMRKVLK